MTNDIPDIPENLKKPITLLISFATIMHGVLVEMANGTPWEEVEASHGHLLRAGEESLRAWGEKVGLGDEDDGEEDIE